MKKRAELDKMAWDIIDKMVPAKGSPAGYAASGRPANFEELVITRPAGCSAVGTSKIEAAFVASIAVVILRYLQ